MAGRSRSKQTMVQELGQSGLEHGCVGTQPHVLTTHICFGHFINTRVSFIQSPQRHDEPQFIHLNNLHLVKCGALSK